MQRPQTRIPLALALALLATFPLWTTSPATPARASGPQPIDVIVPAALRGIPPLDAPRIVTLPPGFLIAAFAAGLGAPRQIAFSPSGVLFAANLWSGEIVALPDRDGDGAASPAERVVFATGLWNPHSLAFDGPHLYVGAHDRVLRFSDADGDLVPDGPPVTITTLPTFGEQITRTVLLGPDRRIYVGIGSSTDAGLESDSRRGAVMRYDLDGGGEQFFARGLRNPVGLAVDPRSGAIWTTEVGADHLGDDHPFEEIDILRQGSDYGWPYCFEERQPDSALYPEAVGICPGTVPPVATLPAHTTPLGMTFYTGRQFPPQYQGRTFVALHGSSKRTTQVGYALVTVEAGPNGENPRVEEFAAGWLLDPTRPPNEPGQNWGRPVYPAVAADGSLYLSDDAQGVIYRIWYAP